MNMMMKNKTRPILSLAAGALLAFGLTAPAMAQNAHVHGAARLELTVDGQRVSLRLESPLQNLLGFEHAPRTDREKAAVKTMTERLGRPDELFALTAAARCKAGTTHIDAPVLGLVGAPAAGGRAGCHLQPVGKRP